MAVITSELSLAKLYGVSTISYLDYIDELVKKNLIEELNKNQPILCTKKMKISTGIILENYILTTYKSLKDCTRICTQINQKLYALDLIWFSVELDLSIYLIQSSAILDRNLNFNSKNNIVDKNGS